jgi:hypothetical protein
MCPLQSLRERGQPRTPLAGHPPDRPLFAINDGFLEESNPVERNPDHKIRARGQRQHEYLRRPTSPFRPPPRYSPRVDDARFAALAIEAGCEWITLDGDYARFPGLKWRVPPAGE